MSKYRAAVISILSLVMFSNTFISENKHLPLGTILCAPFDAPMTFYAAFLFSNCRNLAKPRSGINPAVLQFVG